MQSVISSGTLSVKIHTVNEHEIAEHRSSPLQRRKVRNLITMTSINGKMQFSLPSVSQRILREARYWHMALQGKGYGKDRIAPLEGIYLFGRDTFKFDLPSLVSLWRDDGNLFEYITATWDEQSDDTERRRLVRIEQVEFLSCLT